MNLWIITYDKDPDRTYVFTRSDKAYGCVMSSISTYCDHDENSCPKLNQLIENTGAAVKQMWHVEHLPIDFTGTNGNLHIDVRRVELTPNDDLVVLLSEVQGVLSSCMCKQHCKKDPGINVLVGRINDLLSN